MEEILNRKYKNIGDRNKVIQKIRNIRYGDSFPYYKDKFFTETNLPEETLRKLYIDHKVLNKVVNLFVAQCPILKVQLDKSKNREKKMELIKKALEVINWNSLNEQLYDILDSEGDWFAYIYFDEKTVSLGNGKNKKEYRIPKLKVLKNENMSGILKDDGNETKAYLYKEKQKNQVINYAEGSIDETEEDEITYVFEKGASHKIVNQRDEKGILVKDENGKIVVSRTKIENKPYYADIIPVIHISSNKYQDETFSLIPAEEYIPLCLQIDQIVSDVRAVNRNLGFPRTIFLDCHLTAVDNRIGGIWLAETNSSKDPKTLEPANGQVIDLQLKNGQDSTYKELTIAIDNLYDTVGLTNPSLMMRAGSSDSSKMFQQVNSRAEDKVKKYVQSIIQGFIPYFKILLMENELYDEKTDVGISFTMPDSVIKNSPYDELLIKQLKLNTGLTTITDELQKEGKSGEQIIEHKKELNEEISNGKNDIRIDEEVKPEVKRTVSNANNVEL